QVLTRSFDPASGVDAIKLTPAHVSALEHLPIRATGIRKVIVGGEDLTQPQVSILRAIAPDLDIYNEYGPTETTVGCIVKKIAGADEKILIGSPIANTKVYILSPGLQLVPPGISGEIYISGRGVGRGYLNQEALTREKFISSPFHTDEILYKTGDVGKWTPAGEVAYLGRNDKQVKIRGYRVELGEIEKKLLAYPQIREAVVEIDRDKNGEKIVVGFVVAEKSLEYESVYAFLKRELPAHFVPAQLVQLEKIPLTVNGKINRKLLSRSAGLELRSNVAFVAPRDAVEKELAEIWKKILNKEAIGVKDNFFELGGHSLKVTQLIARMHKSFGVNLEMKSVFVYPTIEQLGQLIASRQRATYEDIQPLAPQPYYELSHGQKRLWILNQLDKNTRAYNIPACYVLEGNFSRAAFESAFHALVERHESLRTTFKVVDGEPRQCIRRADEIGFAVAYTDLSADPEKEARAEHLARQQASAGFDLETGPLLQPSLIKVGDEKYFFVFNLHHIISDGWSSQVLVNELISLYEAYRKGEPNPLPALKIHYKDYAAWQNRQLQEEGHGEHQAYWLQQFAGEVPVLEMPADFTRPPVKSYAGNRIPFLLGNAERQGLRKIAQEHGATMFMVLLAAVKALLYRYTGQEDIVVGSPVAGRAHADLENQIGFYLNTLALRTAFDGKESFGKLLEKVKKSTLDGFAHQVYPIDKLVDELNLTRDVSRSPLFDVMVTLQNTDVEKAKVLEGLTIGGMPLGMTTSKFDLTFDFWETEDGLLLYAEYNTDLFLESRIRRLFTHYKGIVSAIIRDATVPVRHLDYIPAPEKQQLLPQAFEAGRPDEKMVAGLFEEQVAKTPDATALTFNGESFTYDALNRRANELAHYLRETYAIGPNDLVGLMLE
ncbi:MAG: AMP-binding protein, partial [Cytophagales bacterium]|nr:AMP-binding protein [Cytophagales bacterium]